MNDASLEEAGVGKLRRLAGGIAVIARAREQEIAGQRYRFLGPGGRFAHRFHGPSRILRRPGGAFNLVPEANIAVDARIAGGIRDVIANVVAGRNRDYIADTARD